MRLRGIFGAENLGVGILKRPHRARLKLLVRRLEIRCANLRQERLRNDALDHGVKNVGLGFGVGDEAFLQHGNVGIEGTETCDGLLDAKRHGIAKRVAVQAGSVLAPEKIGLAAQSHIVADENFASGNQFDCHALVVGGTKAQRKGEVVMRLMLEGQGSEKFGTNKRLAVQLAFLDGELAVHDAESPAGQVVFDVVDERAVGHGHEGEGAWRRRNVNQIATKNLYGPAMGAKGSVCCGHLLLLPFKTIIAN